MRAPPGGPNAVFGKILKNNSNFGSWRTPLGKILDPPLTSIRVSRNVQSWQHWQFVQLLLKIKWKSKTAESILI